MRSGISRNFRRREDLVPPLQEGHEWAVEESPRAGRERCGRFPAPEEGQVDLNWR